MTFNFTSVFSAPASTLRHHDDYTTPLTMANIDRHVADLLDSNPHASLEDEDDLIAQLEDEENDAAIDAFREQRIQQLHAELTRAKDQRTDGFGNYDEIKDEKELMDLTTKCNYAIVHFAKDDFARCRTMDGHLTVRLGDEGPRVKRKVLDYVLNVIIRNWQRSTLTRDFSR